MLSDRTRAVLDKLNLDIQPVAVKFLLDPPEWAERTDKVQSLCMYMSEAVKEDKCICVTAENDSCVGKAFLGFEPIPPAPTFKLSEVLRTNFPDNHSAKHHRVRELR